MSRPFRKAAALIAVYAIALQAVLTGFLVKTHSGDAFAVTCAGGAANGSGAPAPPGHDSGCSLCPLACGGAAAAVIAADVVSFLHVVEPLPPPSPWLEAPPAAPRHQPQASRAPPV